MAIAIELTSARSNLLPKRYPEVQRRLTDRVGFVLFWIFLLNWIYRLYLCNYYNNHLRETDDRSDLIKANELRQNDFYYANASDVVTKYNTSQLINLTLYKIGMEELISGFRMWQFGLYLKLVFDTCNIQRTIAGVIEISHNTVNQKYYLLVLTIHITRLITIVIFLCGLYFSPTNSSHLYIRKSVSGLLWSELFLWLTTTAITFSLKDIAYTFPEIKETFKSTLRFLTAHRYLFLFRTLILMSILLLLSWVALMLKGMTMENWNRYFFTYFFTLIGSFYLPFFLHTYGKIVIMAATAKHNWSQDKKDISFQDLLSAITVITRYHLGSTFLNTMGNTHHVTFHMFDEGTWPLLPQEQYFITTYPLSHIYELSKAFTAVLGYDIHQAMGSVRYLDNIQRLPLVSESNLSLAWKTAFKMSSSITLYAMTTIRSIYLQPLSITVIPILFYYGISSIVYYILTTIDIIENTIDFCKIDMTQIITNDGHFDIEYVSNAGELVEDEMSLPDD